MFGQQALDQCDRLCEDRDVALADAFDVVVGGERMTFAALEIRIYDRRLHDAFVDFQRAVVMLFAVDIFVVFHIGMALDGTVSGQPPWFRAFLPLCCRYSEHWQHSASAAGAFVCRRRCPGLWNVTESPEYSMYWTRICGTFPKARKYQFLF